VFIFRIAMLRWTFTVASAMPDIASNLFAQATARAEFTSLRQLLRGGARLVGLRLLIIDCVAEGTQNILADSTAKLEVEGRPGAGKEVDERGVNVEIRCDLPFSLKV
jgi:hypothetical protein